MQNVNVIVIVGVQSNPEIGNVCTLVSLLVTYFSFFIFLCFFCSLFLPFSLALFEHLRHTVFSTFLFSLLRLPVWLLASQLATTPLWLLFIKLFQWNGWFFSVFIVFCGQFEFVCVCLFVFYFCMCVWVCVVYDEWANYL